MSSDEPGVDDFQLYLLHTMAPPARLLSRALGVLGRTEREMAAAADAVSRALKPQLGPTEPATTVAGFLHTALEDAHVPQPGDGVRQSYRLPLWEDLLFEVSFAYSGRVIERAGFCRGSSRGVPTGAPEPWKLLDEDLPRYFAEAREIDAWSHYRTFSARTSGSEERFFLRFAWGLLQQIEPVPEAKA